MAKRANAGVHVTLLIDMARSRDHPSPASMSDLTDTDGDLDLVLLTTALLADEHHRLAAIVGVCCLRACCLRFRAQAEQDQGGHSSSGAASSQHGIAPKG